MGQLIYGWVGRASWTVAHYVLSAGANHTLCGHWAPDNNLRRAVDGERLCQRCGDALAITHQTRRNR